jgi:hypothetical protein
MKDYIYEHPWRVGIGFSLIFFATWLYVMKLPQLANGFDELKEYLPFGLFISACFLSIGLEFGYGFRGDENASNHNCELEKMKHECTEKITICDKKLKEAEINEANGLNWYKEGKRMLTEADNNTKAMTQKMEEDEKEAAKKIQSLENRLKKLQEEHSGRGQKVENLEKRLRDSEKKATVLEIENLSLVKKNLALLKGGDPSKDV